MGWGRSGEEMGHLAPLWELVIRLKEVEEKMVIGLNGYGASSSTPWELDIGRDGWGW